METVPFAIGGVRGERRGGGGGGVWGQRAATGLGNRLFVAVVEYTRGRGFGGEYAFTEVFDEFFC